MASRLVRGTFWALIGTVFTRALSLVTSVVVARLLGKEDFGALGILQSTVAMFHAFAGFGLGLTATKYVAEFRRTQPERAGSIIALSIATGALTGAVVSGTAYFGASWLALHSLAAPHLAPLIQLSALSLLLSAINGSQSGALSGLESFKRIAQLNVVSGVTSVLLTLVGVVWLGLFGAILAQVITDGVSCVLSHLALRREMRRSGLHMAFAHWAHEMPVLWRFSLPAVLSGLMVVPVHWLCNSLLVQQPNGYSEMGAYNASSSWRNVLMYLPMILVQASLPMLSSATHQDDRDNFLKTMNMTQSVMVTIAFPVATLLMMAAVPILRLYGTEFTSGDTVLIGVLFTALVQCIGAAGGPALEARGRMWFALVMNATWGLMYFGFVYAFVDVIGANALAFGAAAAYVVLTIWVYVYLREDLPAGMLGRVMLALAFAVALVAFCLLLPVHARLYAALPATALSGFVALMYLTDRQLWRTLANRRAAERRA